MFESDFECLNMARARGNSMRNSAACCSRKLPVKKREGLLKSKLLLAGAMVFKNLRHND